MSADQPSTWLTCISLWAASLYLPTTTHLGISTRSLHRSSLYYEIAIMSLALGVMRGVAVLTKISGSLALVSSAPTLATRTVALGSVGLAQVLIAAIPALWMGHIQPGHVPWEVCFRLVLVLLSIVALASLLLRFDLPAGSTPWLLGVAILLAPMLLPHPLPNRSLGLLAAALCSAAWLLDHPPGRTA